MFGRKKKIETRSYDSGKLQPAVKASICTGEKVAGFIERESGKFEDIMLIRSEEDMQEFIRMYDIQEEIQKIW